MGLGGDLIFTAIIREIKLVYPEKNIYLLEPRSFGKYSTILTKLLYRKIVSYNPSLVFLNNPYLSQGWISNNSIIIDRLDPNNHYVIDENDKRVIWKGDKHVVETICANFNIKPKSVKPDLFFTKEEEELFTSINEKINKPYITIEPYGKTSYFSTNKLWFLDRWQLLVNSLVNEINIVQLGDGTGPTLENVISYNGLTTFRQSSLIIKNSELFIGTDGSLMHVAAAVDTKGLILYHGVSPSILHDQQSNKILKRYVECAPCGLKIQCPYQKKCMDFSVDEVFSMINNML